MAEELVRLLHPKHYSREKQRYASVAFSMSSDGGVSVIDTSCVKASRRTLCAHIANFYSPEISGDPAIFWKFNRDALPAKSRLEQQTTPSGDDCHYNIIGMTKGECRAMLRGLRLDNFHICDLGRPRPLTKQDIEQQVLRSSSSD